MTRKIQAIIMTLTHLLCIILGYCIAIVHFPSIVAIEATTDVTEIGMSESMTQTVTVETETKEYTIVTENPIIFTEIAEKPTEATEATEAEDIPVYTPSVAPPPATQPPATEPPVTQPPVTEVLPTEKPEEQTPSYDSSNDLGDF